MSAHRDHRPRADVLRQAASAMGCSGQLDADARAIIAHRLRTESVEPGEMTAAEWATAERIATQAAAALAYDTTRRDAARASGWTRWPPRAPSAPPWPTKGKL